MPHESDKIALQDMTPSVVVIHFSVPIIDFASKFKAKKNKHFTSASFKLTICIQ